jgi:S-adenosylmethionine:tRNA ribosyltransferase-isomerase
MNVADFDFELPAERIAQRPASQRDAARLLVLDRESGALRHRRFSDLVALLQPGDLLVLNDTRVIPARLVGHKPTGGRVELLLVEPVEPGASGEEWRCLVKASRPPVPGSSIDFGQGFGARVLERDPLGWRVRLEARGERPQELLERVGQVPLPPYIRRDDAGPDAADGERYQTVFARQPGAIAAPTAGLHFTEELLQQLEHAGIAHTFVTLHVGPGTFQPVTAQRVEEHRMHPERFEIPADAARAVASARSRSGRVVAVGTTVVRTLESCAAGEGRISPGRDHSSLFIYPGFRFHVVDALITNFHLPRSTLLMLVSAFAGRECVLAAYRQAIEAGYRFYSYGDAMLIEGGA